MIFNQFCILYLSQNDVGLDMVIQLFSLVELEKMGDPHCSKCVSFHIMQNKNTHTPFTILDGCCLMFKLIFVAKNMPGISQLKVNARNKVHLIFLGIGTFMSYLK